MNTRSIHKSTVFSAVVILMAGVCILLPSVASAGRAGNNSPALATAADVSQAEQAAAQAASQPSPAVAAAIAAEASAAQALAAASNTGNQQAIAAAQASHQAAETSAQAMMAHFSGISPSTIGAMRGDNMNWGEICQNLGMNPSTIGLAHSQTAQHSQSPMMATGRGLVSEQSMGHSKGGFHGTGMGSQHGRFR